MTQHHEADTSPDSSAEEQNHSLEHLPLQPSSQSSPPEGSELDKLHKTLHDLRQALEALKPEEREQSVMRDYIETLTRVENLLPTPEPATFFEPPATSGVPFIPKARSPQARAEQRERLHRLLNEWLADDPAYDKETWSQLSAALEQDHSGTRSSLDE